MFHSFQKLTLFMESVQTRVRSNSLDENITSLDWFLGNLARETFLLIAEEETICLLAFLEQIAISIDEGAVLDQASKRELEGSCGKTRLFEQCRHIKLEIQLGSSRQRIHNLCLHTMNSMDKSDCLVHLLTLFTSVRNVQGMEISVGSETSTCDQQRVLISKTKEAFAWTYNGQHALTAFLEYLDVQWLKMIEEWDPSNGGTLQSRCGTIVQSSCAGKSRLMDRYASKFSLNIVYVIIFLSQISVFKQFTQKVGCHWVFQLE